VAFEAAWRVLLPRRSPADFKEPATAPPGQPRNTPASIAATARRHSGIFEGLSDAGI
jgi:hypothetical protein